MKMWILCLAVLLHLVCPAATTCSLVILDENGKLTNSTICLEEYGTSNCIQFVNTFNTSFLPPGYLEQQLDVQKPAQMDLISLNSNTTDNSGVQWIVPGMSVRWNPPITGSAKNALEGYLLTWDALNQGVRCRLFKFDKNHADKLRNLNFKYNIASLPPSANLTFRIYSMPPPEPNKKDDNNFFVSMRATSSTGNKLYSEPGKWSPTVSVRTYSYGKIDVRFTLSPISYNLTNFQVLLMKTSVDLNNYFKMERYTGELYTPDISEGLVSFDGLESDFYSVIVRVIDTYPNDKEKCYCWLNDGDKYCANTCGTTRTEAFYLNVTETPPTSSVATPPPSSEATPPPTRDTQTTSTLGPSPPANEGSSLTEQEKIIIGVCVGLVLFFIVVILLLCLINKLCPLSNINFVKSCLQRFDNNKKWKPSFQQTSNLDNGKFTVTEPVIKMPALKKKSVYIMSAMDHNKHDQLVNSFVVFLERHCYCDVIYPPHATLSEGAYAWFIKNIETAEKIILIDSLGALEEADIHLKNSSRKRHDLGPEGLLFSLALKHIFIKGMDNVIPIHFDKQGCSKYLLKPHSYKIPEELPMFLKELHSLDGKIASTGVYTNFLPMCKENIQNLPEGKNLLSAIQLSKSYEADNPDWIKHVYTDRTSPTAPPFQTMISASGDSGNYSDLDRTSSVSTQDLTISGPTSPTSDFEQICFSPDRELELSIFTVCTEFPQPPQPYIADDTFSQAVAKINRESAEDFDTVTEVTSYSVDGQRIIAPCTVSTTGDDLSTCFRAINQQYENNAQSINQDGWQSINQDGWQIQNNV
ncbi:uncharacterized protein LOC131958127 [Physella acuta]|uniref:uncharacterized protein LOC131958127 n=1 Tax=Physella acuta TaxID=109671 RepID=UPI0027DC2EF7|nr:uncharacterized protein LOC131958127 [Physella acuta]XP_059178988.1 uncharacterized protein LOC131958127 [Physella acuta]